MWQAGSWPLQMRMEDPKEEKHIPKKTRCGRILQKLSDHRAAFPDSSPAVQLSAAIGISRVLCILGVIYAHAWTGLDGGQLAAADSSAQGLLRWVVMEALGRSSVPLLSMISGWLVLSPAWSRSYAAFLGGKVRAILLPMLLWNLLAMAIISGGAFAGLLQAPMPQSPLNAFDQLLSLTSPNETNVQMAFLRDLFVCMAMAPFLVRLPSGALAAVMTVAAVWSVSGLAFPLLLRPAILLFFAAGMLIRRGNLERRAIRTPLPIAAMIFGALAIAKIDLAALQGSFAGAHPHAMAVVDLSLRFAAALFFWRLAWSLAASRAAAALLRLEPYAFLIFCAHLILIWLGGPAIGKLTGPLGSPLYPLFLLTQPLLIAATSVGFGLLLSRIAPASAQLLSGGRLGRRFGPAGAPHQPMPVRQFFRNRQQIAPGNSARTAPRRAG